MFLQSITQSWETALQQRGTATTLCSVFDMKSSLEEMDSDDYVDTALRIIIGKPLSCELCPAARCSRAFWRH